MKLSEFNLRRLVRTKGSDRIFLKENGISFMKRLNSNGLKIQPWRTALTHGKGPV